MTIEPGNPASLALVRELLGELLPLFTSRRVHVGLDEAWELPQARMDDFLAWVATLRALPELEGREMLMWGDMVSGRADLVALLPAGVTVCEWGYDDWYPFDERCAVLAEAGVPFWVAPGTSSWLSILGSLTNARDHLPSGGGRRAGARRRGLSQHRLGRQRPPAAVGGQRARTGLRRRRVVVPVGQRGPRPVGGIERARLRGPHRRDGRRGRWPSATPTGWSRRSSRTCRRS